MLYINLLSQEIEFYRDFKVYQASCLQLFFTVSGLHFDSNLV